jgi:hypothetical protein
MVTVSSWWVYLAGLFLIGPSLGLVLCRLIAGVWPDWETPGTIDGEEWCIIGFATVLWPFALTLVGCFAVAFLPPWLMIHLARGLRRLLRPKGA